MIVGYARTSTAEQDAGLEAQVRDLKAIGAEEIFAEQVSSVVMRAKLADALRYVRKGDVLAVTKPDRLARSTAELLSIEEDLSKRGVGLVVLSMGLDTRNRNPTNTLMLTMLAAIAQFERALMLERQREGIAKAKGEGKYKGRKPTARNQADQIIALANAGETRDAIAKKLGIGVASVYRVLAPRRAEIPHPITSEDRGTMQVG